jgi:inorganic pyrophosphatase
MNARSIDPLWPLMGLLHKCHPWHGIDLDESFPQIVTSYIEMVPSDTVKYEIDKVTGHLMIDRPQTYSNVLPCLYGFIPRTLCAERVAELASLATGRPDMVGDDDPLDICILTENIITRGDIQARAIPIGGLRMIDKGEADDKIIAVLKGDATYGGWRDIDDVPPAIIARLKHYFLTYKRGPDDPNQVCEVHSVYGAEAARDCIVRSHADYVSRFPDIEELLGIALGR